MKLECLKLDLHRKLEFHELEFQKSGILLLILQPVRRRLAGSCSCGALRCRLPEARTGTKEEWW